MIDFLKKHWVGIALLSLTLFGLFLRLYHIDFQCPSWDEEFTRNLAVTNSSYIIGFSLGVDCNPPLYYLIAHWFYLLFGSASTAIIRLPAAISGTLFIPIVFYVGREFKDETLGFLCAFIVMVSYPLIFYSQFARAYTLAMLAFGIAIYYFVRLWRGDAHILTKLLMVIFITIAIWSHFYAIVPSFLLFVVIVHKYRMKVLPYFVLTGMWCIPFILYVTRVFPARMHENFGGAWWQITYMLPLELLWVPSVFLVPLFIYSVYRYRKDTLILLSGAGVIVTCFLCVLMTFFTPAFPRYVLPILPLLLAVTFYPVAQYLEKYNIEKRAVLFLVIVFIIAACNYTSLLAWYFIRTCVYT